MAFVVKISQEKIEKIARENPDLTHKFIKQLLVAQQEIGNGDVDTFSFSKK